MTTLEILKRARELIASPDKWIQGSWGATADSGPTHQNHRPCRFCVWGAVKVAAGAYGDSFDRESYQKSYVAWRAVERMLAPGLTGGVQYNDLPTTTHADILALLDRAITAEEAR